MKSRRNAIIAALVGMMPALRLYGQEEFHATSQGIFTGITPPDPIMVSFMNNGNEIASFGWSRATSELVARLDGREKRLTAKEIMDALEANG